MTPERAELIHKYWRSCQSAARPYMRDGGCFRVHVSKPMPVTPFPVGDIIYPDHLDILEYHFECGFIDGRPMIRIVCEGVEVEMVPA